MKNLTPVSTFTSPVQAPEDVVDALDAITVETGLQQLANRTEYLKDASDVRVVGPSSATDNALARFDSTSGKLVQNSVITASDAGAIAGVTDLTLSGEALYTTPKTRTVLVSPYMLVGDPANWKLHSSGDYAVAPAPSGVAACDLNALVPSTATITTVRVLIQEGGISVPVTFTIRRRSVSGTTISTPFSSGPHSSAGSTVANWATTGAITMFGVAGMSRDLRITGATTGDRVYLIEITYTDTGPINAA